MIWLHINQKFDNEIKTSGEVLKEVLAGYLQIKSEEIKLRRTENGKPFVKGLNFSVSHCRNLLVIAVSRLGPVGVDVEYENQKKPLLRLASRYFHESEKKIIESQTTKKGLSDFFYSQWTRKEALCKLHGGRLWYFLKQNLLPAQEHHLDGERVNIKTLDIVKAYKLSLAYCGNSELKIVKS